MDHSEQPRGFAGHDHKFLALADHVRFVGKSVTGTAAAVGHVHVVRFVTGVAQTRKPGTSGKLRPTASMMAGLTIIPGRSMSLFEAALAA